MTACQILGWDVYFSFYFLCSRWHDDMCYARAGVWSEEAADLVTPEWCGPDMSLPRLITRWSLWVWWGQLSLIISSLQRPMFIVVSRHCRHSAVRGKLRCSPPTVLTSRCGPGLTRYGRSHVLRQILHKGQQMYDAPFIITFRSSTVHRCPCHPVTGGWLLFSAWLLPGLISLILT